MKKNHINLLFLVSSLGVGGAEKQLITLLSHLDLTRFQLSLAFLKNDSSQLAQLDIQKLEGRISRYNVLKKIDFPVLRELARKIDAEKIDIVVCVNTYPLLYGWLARIKSDRRPHMIEIFHTTELSSIKDQFQMLFYRPFFAISDILVYVCENQRKFWRARALRAKSDTVIHNGIDVTYFSDQYSPDQKSEFRQKFDFSDNAYVVGLCAAMRPEKSHGDMLQAVALLRAANINVKCLFIGDGPERGNIEKQINVLALGQHVKITGYLSDVRLAISSCDVMAIVSHYVETFSLAALEAMALGKPVVMSNIGGASEQINHGNNGYLFERGDIANLVRSLKILMDSRLRYKMGAQARISIVQRFSLPKMIAAYDDVFSGFGDSLKVQTKSGVKDAI